MFKSRCSSTNIHLFYFLFIYCNLYINHSKCYALSPERLSPNPQIPSSNLLQLFSQEIWPIVVLRQLPKLRVKRKIQVHPTPQSFHLQVPLASNSTPMEILDKLVRRLVVHSQRMVPLVPNSMPRKMVSLDRLRRLLMGQVDLLRRRSKELR